MSVTLHQDSPINLMSPILHGSPQTLIVTKEGISVSVSTTLLKMFSKNLSSILDLPPCITTSIIIPDCSLITLGNLLEIITKGYAKQSSNGEEGEETIEDILDVAGLLGISIDTLYFGSKKSKENVLNKQSKLTRKLIENQIMRKDSEEVSTHLANDNYEIPNNIKVEDQDLNSTFQCGVCSKTFKSIVPLGYHYCKHFVKDLLSLDSSDTVQDERCVKCDRTFFDKTAMLSHIGVKHHFINDILKEKNLPQLQFEDELPVFNIKSEMEEQLQRSCELCDTDFTSLPLSSLAYHYCNHFSDEMKTLFGRFYTDNSCKICQKTFNTKDALMLHIGVRHGKVNTILNLKQMQPLKFPKKRGLLAKANKSTEPTIFAKENILNALREPKEENESTDVLKSQADLSKEKFDANTCFVCDKTSGNSRNLKQHICTHFWDELKSICSGLITEGNICGVCNETSKNFNVLIKHIGISHGKLDDILKSKGYPVLSSRKYARKSHKENSLLAEPRVPRKSNGADVKEIRECEVCSKESESVSKLGQHMVTNHFFKEIKETYQNLYNGAECLLCNKSYAKNVITIHIGATHNKIDEILMRNGLKPLKTKIIPNIRKIEIKKERSDEATGESVNNMNDPQTAEKENVPVEQNDATDEQVVADEANIIDSYSIKYI